MKNSVIEIVDVILRRLQERPESVISEKRLRSWLARQGYNAQEIEVAVRLVGRKCRFAGARGGEARRPASRTEPASVERTPRRISVRMLTPYEQFKLTPEARNALARLELYELITPYEVELILDNLNQLEGEIGLEEFDYLLSWLVCGNRDLGFQQTVYGVFEGKRDKKTLH